MSLKENKPVSFQKPLKGFDGGFAKRRRTGKSARTGVGVIKKGDVLKELRKLENGRSFDLVIADPPYNIGKDFGNHSDKRDLQDYAEWSLEWINECLRLVKSGAPVYVYGFAEILAHIAVRIPVENQRWLVWHYTNKTVPSLKFWQRSHETILCLWTGKRPDLEVDSIRVPYTETYKRCAGKVRKETKCRYSSKGKKTIYNAHPDGALPRDVLKYPALAGGAGYAERWFMCKTCSGVFSPEKLREHDGHDVVKHPTQKPLALAEQLISSVQNGKKGKVLIPFAGSGSECVAAKILGMDYFGIEINEDYINLARGWLESVGA